MTKPIRASDHGLHSHYKIRIALPGALLHIASWNAPRVDIDRFTNEVIGLKADLIDDPAYGDTLGYINWSTVTGVTWRWSP